MARNCVARKNILYVWFHTHITLCHKPYSCYDCSHILYRFILVILFLPLYEFFKSSHWQVAQMATNVNKLTMYLEWRIIIQLNVSPWTDTILRYTVPIAGQGFTGTISQWMVSWKMFRGLLWEMLFLQILLLVQLYKVHAQYQRSRKLFSFLVQDGYPTNLWYWV